MYLRRWSQRKGNFRFRQMTILTSGTRWIFLAMRSGLRTAGLGTRRVGLFVSHLKVLALCIALRYYSQVFVGGK